LRLTHVRLLADDFGACFRFYRDALGLQAFFGTEDGPYADFRTGEASLALFARSGQAEEVDLRAAGDGSLVIMRVDDVGAAAERLGEHIVSGPTDREDWGIRVLYVRDPAGNLLELNQHL
jgi:catechol 2,3-dioxygenase-like lactoylglutathione lyase family enzyme